MESNRKLKEKCDALAEMVISIAPIYISNLHNKNKKQLIETTIGASIWYLPHGIEFWTGNISFEAISQFLTSSTPKLSKDHQYPRKVAARDLLLYNWDEIEKPGDRLLSLYKQSYGMYNFITPRENKYLTAFQKENVFISIEKSYQEAGIHLIKVTEHELRKIKKRDKQLIKNLLTMENR